MGLNIPTGVRPNTDMRAVFKNALTQSLLQIFLLMQGAIPSNVSSGVIFHSYVSLPIGVSIRDDHPLREIP